jgi:hypothetical protein
MSSESRVFWRYPSPRNRPDKLSSLSADGLILCSTGRDFARSRHLRLGAKRRQEYFKWAKEVVDRLRGVHPGLEKIFDEWYARRPS